MISDTLPSFWSMYYALPPGVRRAAREAFGRFSTDPYHPGLRFGQLTGYPA